MHDEIQIRSLRIENNITIFVFEDLSSKHIPIKLSWPVEIRIEVWDVPIISMCMQVWLIILMKLKALLSILLKFHWWCISFLLQIYITHFDNIRIPVGLISHECFFLSNGNFSRVFFHIKRYISKFDNIYTINLRYTSSTCQFYI